jgi:prephenate dehydrogenase
VGCARTRATLDAAVEIGAADCVTSSIEEACADAELVILAAPPDAILADLPRIARAVPPDAVVTDAASVKSAIVRAAEPLFGSPSRFVGGHPIAGSERTGVRNARRSLFEGTAYVLTPTPNTDPAALDTVRDLVKHLGGRPVRLSPQDHDRAVGAASHLPHIAAAALARAVIGDPEAAAVHGAGLRDTTRIAAGDPALWRQIVLANADNVAAPLDRLIGELTTVREAIARGDAEAVEAWLRAAGELRAGLEAPPSGGGS